MSKRVDINTYCDNHDMNGDHNVLATVERTIKIDGEPARTNDLCAECDSLIIEPLRLLLGRGIPADAAPLRARVRKGPGGLNAEDMPTLCPEDGKVSKNRGSLNQHLASQHGKRFRDYPNQLRTPADYEGLPHHY